MSDNKTSDNNSAMCRICLCVKDKKTRFVRDKRVRKTGEIYYGYRKYCKDCYAIKQKSYYSKNKERLNEYSREYRKNHLELFRAYSKKDYQKKKEKLKKKMINESNDT